MKICEDIQNNIFSYIENKHKFKDRSIEKIFIDTYKAKILNKVPENKLNSIDNEKEYDIKIKMLGYLITSSAFTLLFGGSFKDSLFSGFIGIILCILEYFLNILKTNNFFINIISGFLVSLLAFIAVKFNIAPNMNEIIIGSLMPLVPGLSITNSLRDIIDGNLVAGSAKFIEAFFIAVGIAIGSAGVLSILIN
ncbi:MULTISPECIES: threonine/serine ThrE exporter family protein [Bacillota]|uniref:Threonine/serine exporter family protein n=2 Tax=Bacillota TaxID=1239 RepID=A0A9X4B712_ENTFC|nr:MULTISPECIES: threonine/serine exporter family protein [Bacillota]MDC4242386.1 threonine/serine exporter family protein [Clostridium tertium]MDC4248957.1 threonine/serine exporter family protein [Enterococcus faecium]